MIFIKKEIFFPNLVDLKENISYNQSMKRLSNILFTILMMGIVLIVYLHIEEIGLALKNVLVKKNEIEIKETNAYTRDYKFKMFTKEEDFIPYSKDDIINIYYNILNNGWDTFTFYCPEEYTNCQSELETIAFDDELLSKINNYVHPFNSFEHINTKIVSNGEIVVDVTHKYNEDKINIINNKIDEIIKDLSLENKTDEEKITLVHDYIIKNTTYDTANTLGESTHDSTSAYGSLIEGYSVCSGYSDAMGLFLDRFNIPNFKVSSENHVWNVVYIYNKWLHLDLTWDDTENPLYSNNYFLITKEKLFSLDDKEHNFDKTFFLEA